MWNYLKDITSIGYIKLYCFASYGEIDLQNLEISSAFYSCPFEIRPASKLDLGFMKFSDDEMLEYAEKYRSKLWTSLSSEKMQHIACTARDLSNGHPGIFSSIIELMRSEFSPFADDVLTQGKLMNYCFGKEMGRLLMEYGAAKCVADLTPEETQFCIKVLQSGGHIESVRNIDNYEELKERLIEKSVIFQKGDTLVTPCKIFSDALLLHSFGQQ